MKKYKLASILMMIQGGLMEIGTFLFLIPVLVRETDISDIGRYFSFIVPYLQENLELMMMMGLIFGIVRVTGAVGLWRNRMWGLVLSVINCVVTMVLMIFMLPAGIMDGILSCSALVLILLEYFGDKEIDDYSSHV